VIDDKINRTSLSVVNAIFVFVSNEVREVVLFCEYMSAFRHDFIK